MFILCTHRMKVYALSGANVLPVLPAVKVVAQDGDVVARLKGQVRLADARVRVHRPGGLGN